jgi:predicted Zn-dependent peptidase
MGDNPLMRGMVCVAIALMACASAPNFAGLEMTPRRTELRERIVTRTLQNGLRVVLLPDMRTNLVMVGVHYNVGGSDDPRDGEGLAHYVEHILFDASFHGEDGEALRDVGLEANAMTSADRTFFYLEALDSEIDAALEISARRFEAGCDALDDASLERERDVVIEENKLRSSRASLLTALQQAVWGSSPPYGHGAGGTDFARLSRATLCKFIEEHYGPASAVLVVSGHIPADAMTRVIQRFEHIPTRPVAKREADAPPSGTPRLVVKELEHPTAVVIFDAPAEGTDADAAIDAVDNRSWTLERSAPARYATTIVLGEDRERVIVAIAETDDAKRLDELVRAMTKAVGQTRTNSVESYKVHYRASLAARLDDTFAAVPSIAAQVARGERPTRFRDLRQLDKLTQAQVARLFEARKVRAAFLLPEVGVKGTQRASDISTALHHVEALRGPAGSNEPAVQKRSFAIADYRLANGLRVVLAPDADALSMDARLVITGTAGADAIDLEAAALLEADPEDLSRVSVRERLQWYGPMAALVIPDVEEGITTFRIRGLATFGDWHVWNLAWHVLRGTYVKRNVDTLRRLSERAPQEVPRASTVVQRRLAGVLDVRKLDPVPSVGELQAFRHARYVPEMSTLIVCGKFDEDAMRKEVATLFGEWRAQKAVAHPRIAPVLTPVGLRKDDAPTVELAIAFPHAPPANSHESVANEVLAELLDLRLRVVRESLGATYGIHTLGNRASFVVYGAVEPAYAAEAAAAIAKQIELIRAGDASLIDDFMRARKKVLARALALPLGASNRAEALQRLVIAGGNVQELGKQIDDIHAVDLGAIQKLATRYTDPKAMLVAGRGEKTAVEAALRALGVAMNKVEWLDAPQGGRL